MHAFEQLSSSSMEYQAGRLSFPFVASSSSTADSSWPGNSANAAAAAGKIPPSSDFLCSAQLLTDAYLTGPAWNSLSGPAPQEHSFTRSPSSSASSTSTAASFEFSASTTTPGLETYPWALQGVTMQTLEDDFTLPTEQEYRLYELAQRDSELASSHFTETATSTPAIGTYTTALDLAPMPEDVQITTPNLLPESFVHSSQTSSLGQNSEDSFWHAVVMRDPATVGTFWYGVTSTKIYCRPTCPSRRPMRSNAVFFVSLADADAAGYRPCKRCAPNEVLEPSVLRQTTSVLQAAALIEESISKGSKPPLLTQLAQAVNMSPFYFQRTFKKHYGVSPKVYAMRLAKSRVGGH